MSNQELHDLIEEFKKRCSEHWQARTNRNRRAECCHGYFLFLVCKQKILNKMSVLLSR